MFHTLGNLNGNFTIQIFTGGVNSMTQNNNNNSVNISGGNVSGNQFAAGSQDFQGVINNISSEQSDKLDQLTDKLIDQLNQEKLEGADPQEIINAVKQVQQQAKEKKVNKISLKGVLSGINMVMQSVKNASGTVKEVYQEWNDYIDELF